MSVVDASYYTHYQAWCHDQALLSQMYTFFVKHRLQDTHDPLTHTLILMATSPIQFAMCESGIMPFKTTNLPIYPFVDMEDSQRTAIASILSDVPTSKINESVEGCGKISVSVTLPVVSFIDKQTLLKAFVDAVTVCSGGGASITVDDERVPRRFCRIIFQRFLSSVSMSPTSQNEILEYIDSAPH